MIAEPFTIEELAVMSDKCETMDGWPAGQKILHMGFPVITDEELRRDFACETIEKRENRARTEKLKKDFCESKGIKLKEFDAAYTARDCAIYRKEAPKDEVPELAVAMHSGKEYVAKWDHGESVKRESEIVHIESRILAAKNQEKSFLQRGAIGGGAEMKLIIDNLERELKRLVDERPAVRRLVRKEDNDALGMMVPTSVPEPMPNILVESVRQMAIAALWGEDSREGAIDTCTRAVCRIEYADWNRYMDKVPEYVLEAFKVAKKVGFDKFEVAYPIMEDEKQIDPVLIGIFEDHNENEIKYEIQRWE